MNKKHWYNKLGIVKTYEDLELDDNWYFINLKSHDDEEGYNEGEKVKNLLTIAFLKKYRKFELPWQIIDPIFDSPTYDYDGDDKHQIGHQKLKEMGCKVKYNNYTPNSYEFSIWKEHLRIYAQQPEQLLYNEGNHKPLFDFWWNFSWKRSERTKYLLLSPDGTTFYEVNNDCNFITPSGKRVYDEWQDHEEIQPSVKFAFKDYDGEENTVTCKLTYAEYSLGDNAFNRFVYKLFGSKPDICTTLELAFDKEIGEKKGSWKGGTMGTSINLLPKESLEEAFKRYCSDPEARGFKADESSNMEFIGKVDL